MASYGRHTLAMISAGFYEFSRTSADYVARVPVFHRLVAAGTLIISTVLFGFLQIRGRMLKVTQGSALKDEGLFQKLKKSKVVKLSLNVIDRLLSMAENLIIPINILNKKQSPKVNREISVSEVSNFHETNGVPKLLNLRHVSNSNGGTPCNNQKPSDTAEDWTPFSSVSAVDESVFDRSCVSLMEDLSQSTISTPIRDLRQQMASKIRAWRLAIRDLEGTPEFPTWSPEPARETKKSNLMSRLWYSLTGWLPISFTGSDPSTFVPGSGRKRKRMDADDDDLALYIPHHKGQSKLNGRAGLVGTEAAEQPALPSIRGLSVVPIIGNWFSAEPSNEQEETKSKTDMQLDHISLIQRDFISPSKQASESTSDSEAYEILDIETKNM